ncbi:unnamed protein product [Paramecium sonneborni]|uniref:Uncharacterized protein n=1 Tax=Paramecium sonneborni TaxID=65129 RepID=A0A8S1PI06_9CILI|nr:unnamed protein product [Paramecium sonneborni]
MRNIEYVGEKYLCMVRILEAFIIYQISYNWFIFGFGENIYTKLTDKYFQKVLSNQFFISLFIYNNKLALFECQISSVFFNQLQKKERELFCTNCRRNFKFIPNYQIFKYKFLFFINKLKFTQRAQSLKTHSIKGFIHHFMNNNINKLILFKVLNLNQYSQLFINISIFNQQKKNTLSINNGSSIHI